ncbi:uncharacterized protein BXZ73DRAFT_76103 [Epithele typhae]|uniref:uncharacterized protein n=1 Tax=Epithele typhae TaxID=378194 RepID=UPI0020078E8A|nr:uncharacterized protein BXZ73DRAFT_76103 [Epithele typhae]KAH9939406.1 hypothetical protein BXZ73DRAFT_76103 [Epithele typhae]
MHAFLSLNDDVLHEILSHLSQRDTGNVATSTKQPRALAFDSSDSFPLPTLPPNCAKRAEPQAGDVAEVTSRDLEIFGPTDDVLTQLETVDGMRSLEWDVVSGWHAQRYGESPHLWTFLEGCKNLRAMELVVQRGMKHCVPYEKLLNPLQPAQIGPNLGLLSYTGCGLTAPSGISPGDRPNIVEDKLKGGSKGVKVGAQCGI